MGFDCVQWVNLLKQKSRYVVWKTYVTLKSLEPSRKFYWFSTSVNFTKIKSLEIKHSIVRSCLCTIRGINWFDCQMRSNSIPGLSFIEFDWVQLKLFHQAPMTMYKLLNVSKKWESKCQKCQNVKCLFIVVMHLATAS